MAHFWKNEGYSGCGAIGRAVASSIREPRFESNAKIYMYFQLHWKAERK